jgi:nucleotide-binding universal stress UspA family protein
MKIEHILLTTDLSPESLRILGRIGDLARTMGARVTLLNVVHDMMVVPHAESVSPTMGVAEMQDMLQTARVALEDAKAGLGPGVEVQVDARVGTTIASSVANYAADNDVDLIALSTHGRTGFRHLVLGSVAEAIMRHSHCPVLCFPPDEAKV